MSEQAYSNPSLFTPSFPDLSVGDDGAAVMGIAQIQQSQARSPSHPVLKAFEKLHFGHLTIITPEQERLVFEGPQTGPKATMILRDWNVLDDGVARGEIGFAESYIDERWDSDDLPAFLTLALMNYPVLEKFFHGHPFHALRLKIKSWLHSNTLEGSRKNIAAHYDLGNRFYKLWLDDSMTYSCALFDGDETRTLEEAQQAKYQRILNKLQAKPGDHILEIGCGWGGFAEVAARRRLRVTAITLSNEQAWFAETRLKRTGLNHLAEVRLIDYREIEGKFDHIVSIGMFEHVGEKYWPTYFETVRDRLKPGGRAMIQSITLDDDVFEKTRNKTGFIEQYIFPGGMLPSKSRFRRVLNKAGLECHEIFPFGLDYKRTLTEWLRRFNAEEEAVRLLGCDNGFIRLWRFYLSSCIASFASFRTDVIQAEVTHRTA